MKHILKRTILIVFINLLYMSTLWAGSQLAAQDSLALDPSIRYGRLKNGFTYYIKHVPETLKIEMNFYIKVGFYHENATQLDFAHAIEHLAFTTAKHFPGHLKDNLVLRNPLDINNIAGFTTLLYSHYLFNISSEDIQGLDSGLLWFRDIADLNLTEEAIDRERGVLRQEVTYKLGNDFKRFFLLKKIMSEIFPCQQDFSDFFNHNKSFSSKSLIDFYKEWYRPDRMGLVITGDIKNIDALEDKLRERFSDIPNDSIYRLSKTDCRLEYLKRTNQFIGLEREQMGDNLDNKSTEWYLYFKNKDHLKLFNRLEGLKQSVLLPILASMVNARIQKDSLGFGQFSPPSAENPYYQIGFSFNNNSGQQKLIRIIQILKQAKIHGFKVKEWNNAKKVALDQLGDTTSISYWKNQLTNNFIDQEPLPKNKRRFLQQFISDFSLDDFNTFTNESLPIIPNDIGIIVPAGQKTLIPDETNVRKWITQASDASVEPYIEPKVQYSRPFMSKEEIMTLKEVGVKLKGFNTEIGVEELELENGIKIVLQRPMPSDLLENHIFIHGFSPKGASCYSKDDYFSAINAPSIVQSAGIGNLDGKELRHTLSKTSFSGTVRPYVNFNETGIRVNGTLGDLEKMLQLIYLYFQKPRNDANAFERWKKIEKSRYLFPSYGLISADFNGAIMEVLNDNSEVATGTKRFKGIMKTDGEKAFKIFKELYGDTSGFTFIISGDYSNKNVMPLIQKYLGNLSNSNRIACDVRIKKHITIPQSKDPSYHEFSAIDIGASYDMKSVKYSILYLAKATDSLDWKESIRVNILGILLNSQLRDFRYKNGASLYDFSGFGRYNRTMNSYQIGIKLDCVEEELEWLRIESKKLIKRFQDNDFGQEWYKLIYRSVLEPIYGTRPGKIFATKEIYEYYRYKEPLIKNDKIEQFVKSLTMEDIHRTATKYLTDENMVEFVMKDTLKTSDLR